MNLLGDRIFKEVITFKRVCYSGLYSNMAGVIRKRVTMDTEIHRRKIPYRYTGRKDPSTS